MDGTDAMAMAIIELAARQELADLREELTEQQIKVAADQIALKAWPRLKRDLPKLGYQQQ